jgi:hypothetical protein
MPKANTVRNPAMEGQLCCGGWFKGRAAFEIHVGRALKFENNNFKITGDARKKVYRCARRLGCPYQCNIRPYPDDVWAITKMISGHSTACAAAALKGGAPDNHPAKGARNFGNPFRASMLAKVNTINAVVAGNMNARVADVRNLLNDATGSSSVATQPIRRALTKTKETMYGNSKSALRSMVSTSSRQVRRNSDRRPVRGSMTITAQASK